MTDEREKLIKQMARAIRNNNKVCNSSYTTAAAALSVAERALAEKHARIVEDMLSDYCDVTRRVIAAAIRASVGRSETNDTNDGK